MSRLIRLTILMSFLTISFAVSSPILAQNECPDTPISIMSVGIRGRVTYTDGTATRLRSAPTVSGSTVLMSMPEGYEFDVLDGPICADGYNWWQAQTDDGLVGWAAEGIVRTFTESDVTIDNYWIEPISSQPIYTFEGTTHVNINLDSHRINYVIDNEIFVYDTETRMETVLLSLDADKYNLHINFRTHCPIFSHDYDYVAYIFEDESDPSARMITESQSLIILEADDGKLITQIDGVLRFAWSPQDNQLAYITVKIGNDRFPEESYIWLYDISMASNEHFLQVPHRQSANYLVEYLDVPAWSPDGAYLTYAIARSHHGGDYERRTIVSMESDVSSVEWLSSSHSWSPDGTRIVFEEDGRLFVANWDGTDRQWLIGDSLNPLTAPQWSPDGRYIVFGSIAIGEEVYGRPPANIQILSLDTAEIMELSTRFC